MSTWLFLKRHGGDGAPGELSRREVRQTASEVLHKPHLVWFGLLLGGQPMTELSQAAARVAKPRSSGITAAWAQCVRGVAQDITVHQTI